MKQIKKIAFAVGLACSCVASLSAQDYVTVGKDGNVYDEANAKYITVNQNNDDVTIVSGMVFATSQHTPGWYMIEYSPGLHAFIPEQIVITPTIAPQPGIYDIKNKPGQKLNVRNDGDEWIASVDGLDFRGVKSDNVIVFLDGSTNAVAYSLVDLGSDPIAITYDNSVTKFF